jgi:hypothetical protein
MAGGFTMLEHRALALLGAAILTSALAGCGAGSSAPATPVAAAPAPVPVPVQPAGPVQSVHISGGGSEVEGSSSVTDFAPGMLSYKFTSLVSPQNVEFTAVLSDQDFQRLATLIESGNLTTTLSQVPAGDAPCRINGYAIEIKRGGVTYKFSIPGTKLCGGLTPPPGLFDLIKLQDELVAKYRPQAGG